MQKRSPFVWPLVLLVAASSCDKGAGKSDAAEDAAAPKEKGSETTAAPEVGKVAVDDANMLASSYPQGLTVAAFPTEAAAATSAEAGDVAVATGLFFQKPPVGGGAKLPESPPPVDPLDPPGGQCFATKAAFDAQNAPPGATAKAGGFFDADLNRRTSRKREDEKLAVSGKGDCLSKATIRALELIASSSEEALTGGSSACYEPDWGLFKGLDADNANEVCMVSFTRQEIADMVAYLDAANGLMQGMLCKAKKAGLASKLPDEDQVIDLKDVLAQAFAERSDKKTVKVARIKRLKNKNGRAVYRTDFTIENARGKELAFHVVHSPGDDKNTSYNGNLWIKHAAPGLNPQSTGARSKGVSLTYSRTGEGATESVRFDMRMMNAKDDVRLFDKSGVVDFNSGAAEGGQFPTVSSNEHASNMKSITFDGNPDTGAGRMSYWVNFGGNYDEIARGFVFNTEQVVAPDDATKKVLKGCGFAGGVGQSLGGAVSIRKALKEGLELKPIGHLRPNMCDANGNPQEGGPEIWRQCFVQKADGSYEVDATKITTEAGKTELFDFYDPTKLAAVDFLLPSTEGVAPVDEDLE